MSINFGQFPTPTLPIQPGDVVVGYQLVGGVPTLAQYTMLQLAGVLGPIIGGLPPTGPAGGDLSGTYPNPTVSAVHATSGTLAGVSYTTGAITNSTVDSTPVGATTPSTGAFTTLSASSTVSGAGFTARFASPGPIGNTTASTGAFTTVTATGTITPAQIAGIVGTTTNNAAQAGSVGEFITANAATIPLTSGVALNVTSISLTAGDWDVTGQVQFTPAGTTQTTGTAAAINTVSATVPSVTSGLGLSFVSAPFNTGNASVLPIMPTRILVASTTTVFLVASATFSVSTETVSGYIRARRVR